MRIHFRHLMLYEFRKGSSVTIAEKMRFHLAPVGSGSNVLELGISV